MVAMPRIGENASAQLDAIADQLTRDWPKRLAQWVVGKQASESRNNAEGVREFQPRATPWGNSRLTI